MKRRLVTLAVVVALSLPGCANRKSLGAPYALGTATTITGVALFADAVIHPTQCEMAMPGEEDLDPFCLGALGEQYARMGSSGGLVLIGTAVIAATVLIHWYSIWRTNRGKSVAHDTKN